MDEQIETEPFFIEISKIQPSQLYISEAKLTAVVNNISDFNKMTPIPIKKLDNEIIYTDGHTRAYAAVFSKGLDEILVEWDVDELDWDMYRICVNWCKKESIFTIKDLKNRVITIKEYKVLWHERCRKMQEEVKQKRRELINL